MASIDFSVVLHDLDNNPLPDDIAMRNNGGLKVTLTLGRAAANALSHPYPEDTQEADEKFKRGLLALRAREVEQPVQMKAEDIALIKKLIAKTYSPIVVVRAFPLLDPSEKTDY